LRPGSNIKAKRFEFTPETAVRNVLVAQVGRKTVPNTWPGDSEAPVLSYSTLRIYRNYVSCNKNTGTKVITRPTRCCFTVLVEVYAIRHSSLYRCSI